MLQPDTTNIGYSLQLRIYYYYLLPLNSFHQLMLWATGGSWSERMAAFGQRTVPQPAERYINPKYLDLVGFLSYPATPASSSQTWLVRHSGTAILVEQPGLEDSGWFYLSSTCAFITLIYYVHHPRLPNICTNTPK